MTLDSWPEFEWQEWTRALEWCVPLFSLFTTILDYSFLSMFKTLNSNCSIQLDNFPRRWTRRSCRFSRIGYAAAPSRRCWSICGVLWPTKRTRSSRSLQTAPSDVLLLWTCSRQRALLSSSFFDDWVPLGPSPSILTPPPPPVGRYSLSPIRSTRFSRGSCARVRVGFSRSSFTVLSSPSSLPLRFRYLFLYISESMPNPTPEIACRLPTGTTSSDTHPYWWVALATRLDSTRDLSQLVKSSKKCTSGRAEHQRAHSALSDAHMIRLSIYQYQ